MALKYYKNIVCGEQTNTLKIYDDSYNGAALEIGGIRDIRLELMGGQNEVDSPIVKTGLSFTLLDAPDEVAEGKYYGGWEEFYTANPTKYKVVLETNGAVRWTGYITPHSFEEDLVYRGSIAVTARDNIGRLKEFVWDEKGDANGMVSVRDILALAWEKAQIPMPLLTDPNANFPFCNGKAVYESMLVADAFADKTWGDVVESVLMSCGLTLRYADNNTIQLTTLRGLSNVDSARSSKFVGGAHRSIEPSVKGVIIEQGYNVAQGVEQKEADKKRYQEDEAYTYRYWNVFGEEKEAQGVVNPLTTSSEVGAWQNATAGTSLFFNVYGRERRESMQKRLPEEGVMYFAANVVGDRFSYVDKKIADSFVWKMKFGSPVQYYRDFVNLEASSGLGLRKVKLQIISNPTNASKQYYNGSTWQSNECYIEEEYNASDNINEVAIPVSVDTEMTIRFAIIYIEYRAMVQDGMPVAIMNDRGGYYASLLSMSYDIPEDNNSIVSGRRIELEGNTEGNRLLEESIELGAMKVQQLMPQIVVNGMYQPETYRPADTWSFVGQTATYPLMLLIAMQKAAIYGRPCDMITGEVIVDGGVRFDSLITYNRKKYLVLGGTWNVINGRIEGVCLREVVRYEDYWIEGKEVVYSVSIPASSSGSKGGYIGGSGGSGSASGGVRELSALTDVELSAVADDDVLSYVSGKWANVSKADYLADLSARIAKFEDWFVLENGYIKATKGFFSDGTMGARAVGSTGGGGGGLIAYVYGYDAIEGAYYDTDKNNTFNAYTIARLHSRLKSVEDAGYITSSALNGYAKTTDLADYATTSALTSGLANKVDKVSGKGLSENDFTTALLNKLNGIAEGADANVQSDWNATNGDAFIKNKPNLSLYALNSTLAGVAFSGSYADLDGTPQFGDVATSNDYNDLYNLPDLSKYLTSHQAIYGLTIKRNGTSLGIYTPNSASKEIDITVPTKMSDLTDDVVSGNYLPLSGGTMTVTAEEALNIYRKDGAVGIKLSNSVGNAWVGFSPAVYGAYLYTGSHYLHITTDGKACFDNKILLDAGNYSDYALPLSGGTIDGTAQTMLTINSSNAILCQVLLQSAGENKARFGWSGSTSFSGYRNGVFMFNNVCESSIGIKDDGTPHYNGNTLLHSANYSDYALSKSGGTLTNTLYIDGLSTTDNLLSMRSKYADASGACRVQFIDANDAFQGYVMSGWGSLLLAHRSHNQLGVGDSGIWCSSDNGATKNALIHSGNIGSQSVNYATSATRLYANDSYAYGGANPYYLQMRYNVLGDNSWYLSAYPETPAEVSVDRARKLVTPRTIWGQSFDGSGNVDGKIYQDGKWMLGYHSDGNLYLGIDTYNTRDTLIYGRNLYFGTSVGHSMLINSSGNVGIGTTGPQYKLDVDGTARFTGLITADAGIKIGDATITWDASANALKIDGNLYATGKIGAKQ